MRPAAMENFFGFSRLYIAFFPWIRYNIPSLLRVYRKN